jgi:hypothetical protein
MKQSWGHGSLMLDGEFGHFGDDAGDYENVVHGHDTDLPIHLAASWTGDRETDDLAYIAIHAHANSRERYSSGSAVPLWQRLGAIRPRCRTRSR